MNTPAEVEVFEAELVDEPAGRLPAVPGQPGAVDVDRYLSPDTLRLIAASVSLDAARARARMLFGQVVGKGDRPGELRTIGPADGIWPEMCWLAWCARHGRQAGTAGVPATPETLADWVAELLSRGVGYSAIKQARAAVGWLHEQHGHEGHPLPRLAGRVVAGHRRIAAEDGTATPVKRATPVTLSVLRAMVEAMAEHRAALPLLNARDRVLLLLGVPGMLRRSELARLRLKHVTVEDRGLRLWLPTSKTDKGSKGAEVGVPMGHHPETCPKTQFLAWRAVLAEHGLDHGDQPVLCSVRVYGRGRHERLVGNRLDGRDVDRAVKSLADLAGLPAAAWSGHSLRAGGATSAYEGGADIKAIMEQGRWLTVEIVMDYIRRVQSWDINAASKIGL